MSYVVLHGMGSFVDDAKAAANKPIAVGPVDVNPAASFGGATAGYTVGAAVAPYLLMVPPPAGAIAALCAPWVAAGVGAIAAGLSGKKAGLPMGWSDPFIQTRDVLREKLKLVTNPAQIAEVGNTALAANTALANIPGKRMSKWDKQFTAEMGADLVAIYAGAIDKMADVGKKAIVAFQNVKPGTFKNMQRPDEYWALKKDLDMLWRQITSITFGKDALGQKIMSLRPMFDAASVNIDKSNDAALDAADKQRIEQGRAAWKALGDELKRLAAQKTAKQKADEQAMLLSLKGKAGDTTSDGAADTGETSSSTKIVLAVGGVAVLGGVGWYLWKNQKKPRRVA